MKITESRLTEIKPIVNTNMNEDVRPEATAKQIEWSTPQTGHVITLHNDAGWSNHAIAKEMRMAQSTV